MLDLVVFTTEIYCDARSYERQIKTPHCVLVNGGINLADHRETKVCQNKNCETLANKCFRSSDGWLSFFS
jgi:hypothetical protein